MSSGFDLSDFRFVDSHVHHWDPANAQWYPHLAPDFDVSALGVAGADGMKRRYLAEEYLADARPWHLEKYVHVNATSGPKAYLDEAEWLGALGGPLAGVIGTVDLEQSPAEVLDDLDSQAAQPLFRGIRTMHIPDFASSALDAALSFLADRGHVFDFVVHPHTMEAAAAVIHRHPGLAVVVEHVGWPTSTASAEREVWRTGMKTLSGLGDRVACKLSGIGMATHTLDEAINRPWLDEALDLFGEARCLVGSNFPVDGVFGGFDDMMRSYLSIIGDRGAAAVAAVFAGTAERIYRI